MISNIQIIGSRELGGAEQFFIRFANALAQRVSVRCVLPPDSSLLGGLESSIPISKIPMRNVWDIVARIRIKQVIEITKPTIVQTWLGRATRLTKLRKRSGVVHIARLGGYYDVSGYQHADAWVGNTRGICNYLVGKGLPANKVFHIGNFYEPELDLHSDDHEWRVRHALGIGSEDWLILTAARLHPNKGISDLLEAIALIPNEIQGRRTRFVIAGDGPLLKELRLQSTQLALRERICWTGWLDELAPYYQAADLFVCPSRHEPLGNVILEAWFHELPIISTANLGALELINDQVDGIVCPVQDPKALADSVTAILRQSSADRAGLAARGKETLTSNYSKQAIMNAYIELYDQLSS